MAKNLADRYSTTVRVLPCPGPNYNNLTATQRGNLRRSDFSQSVLRPTRKCAPQGLGMISTARSARSLSEPVNPPAAAFWLYGTGECKPATMRPAGRRRSRKRAPTNTVFHGPTISFERDYHCQRAERALRDLMGMHRGVVTYWRDMHLAAKYNRRRRELTSMYPELTAELIRIEGEHRRRFAR